MALTELFAYDRAQTTVTSGGTDAPPAGTVETWVVASSALFGAAQTGISQFHVSDPFAPSEVIAVTAVSGTTWTVTRGSEGTTPVPHASGFLVFQTTTAGFLADLPGLALANTFTADQYFGSGRPWFDVIAFGADPTGTADSTAAFNDCIAAITGALAPATNTRLAKGPMYMPAGTYKITSDLRILSTQNFVMRGAGAGQTNLKASGAGFAQAVVLADGCLDGVFEDFEITGDGTEQVTDAIRIDWTTAAQRSTTGVSIERFRVRNLKFVTAVSLEGTGTRQLDGVTLKDIHIQGSQTIGAWSTSGNWQNGFALGNGSNGNIYDNWAYGCYANACYYGWYVNGSSVALYGSEPNGNAVEFWLNSYAATTIENVQSQNAGQLVVCPASSVQPVSIRDVQMKGYSNASYTNLPWITTGTSFGNWLFENIELLYPLGAPSQPPVINLGTANYNSCYTLINLTQPNSPSAGIVPGTGASVVAVNYKDTTGFNSGTGNYGTQYPLYTVNSGPFWRQDVLANRPAAATYGETFYFATDAQVLYHSNDAAWTTVATPGGGGGGAISEIEPQDLGVVAWTANPAFNPSTVAYSPGTRAGTLLSWAFKIPVAGFISNILYSVDVVGSGLSNCWLGIYSMDGNLLAQCTTDQSSNFTSVAAGTAVLSSPLAVTAGTLYRVGLVVGAASAFPTLMSAGSTASGTFTNMGLARADYMAARSGSGLTALPSSYDPAAASAEGGLPIFVMT